MSDEEQRIRELEEQFPLMADIAFATAAKQALAAGQKILVSEDVPRWHPDPAGKNCSTSLNCPQGDCNPVRSSQPRVRMFAGPNGSGKSTLKTLLLPELLGVYINPDEMEKGIAASGLFDLSQYQIHANAAEIVAFFKTSALLQVVGLTAAAETIVFDDNRLFFEGARVNSYFASVLADFLRQQLLKQKVSFTFETVMSSSDKVGVLRQAQSLGFRTYLYYVATDTPKINASRVRSRVEQGGHDVPEEKIFSRYYRSLDLLLDAVRHTNRAYIFDNSTEGVPHRWLAEITNGKLLEMKVPRGNDWFIRAVSEKFEQRAGK
jgi:predicted ABC-type ATPase